MKSLGVICLLLGSVVILTDRCRAGEPQRDELLSQEKLGVWIEELKSPDYQTRRRAAEMIGRLGPKAKAAVPALRKAMTAQTGIVPGYAGAALWKVDRALFSEILMDKKRQSARERSVAILSLHDIGIEAKELVPVVLKIATDKSGGNREHALWALGSIGADPKAVIPALTDALQDDRAQYARMLSAQALGNLGPKAKEALPVLHRALQDPDPQVRVDAAGAIWKIERQSQKILPVLTEALKSPSDNSAAAARQRAVFCLRDMGSGAKEAFSPLLALWKESSKSYERDQAAAALKAIDASAAAKEGVK